MITMKNAEGYSDPTACIAMFNVITEQIERKKLIYVCSKYRGNIVRNTLDACRYCKFVISRNGIPIAPHLFFPQFLDDENPKERNLAINLGLELLLKCDEIWVFGTKFSNGMKAEIKQAKKFYKPIKFFTEKCEEVQFYEHRRIFESYL
jgi:hypothetical protein